MGRHRGDPPCVDLRRYAGGHHAVIPDTNGISGTKPGRIRCVDKDSLSCIQVQYEQAPPLHFNYNSLHDHARHLLWIYDRICRPGAIGDRTRGGGTSPYPPFLPDVGEKQAAGRPFGSGTEKQPCKKKTAPVRGRWSDRRTPYAWRSTWRRRGRSRSCAVQRRGSARRPLPEFGMPRPDRGGSRPQRYA